MVAESSVHHFTIDLEEYFQVSAFENRIRRRDWDGYESRVVASTQLLSDVLLEHDAHATIFVLGWVAQREPDLIRMLSEEGHEIASHGWDHKRVTHLTPHQFRESVRSTKQLLEDITGSPVFGFRAPSFSITRGREWALDILLEEGYAYDSSLYPVRRPGYGYPGAEPDLHWLTRPSGVLAEVPPSTLQFGPFRLPAGGGAYFRLFPYSLVRAAFRQAERRSAAATFYIHPWEVDPGQPRISVPLHTRVRHYGGLSSTVRHLRRLLTEFRFQPVARTVLAGVEACPVPA
jgi:polysaccharide deacetylase family protein (PEP-CTERM system associated)